jgi:DNA replication and repair protein RecF
LVNQPPDELAATYLSTEVVKAKGSLKIEIGMRLEKGKDISQYSLHKQLRINGVARRAMDLIGQLDAVIFSAQDIELISGAPGLRRRYLDMVGSQLDSHYLFALQRYQRVLLERNHLLKLLSERTGHPEQLEFWDKELIENGSYLILRRQAIIGEINQLIAEIYAKLSGGEGKLGLIYMPSLGELTEDVKSQFAELLHQLRGKELPQGTTLAGPHRDDLRFNLNGIDIGVYGSRGQQRSAALSLRLAEANYLQLKKGDSPILLLDDVLSELDLNRRTCLLEFISPFQQGLITATEFDCFEPSFLSQSAKFKVSGGRVLSTT